MKSLKIISFIILITNLFLSTACNKKPSCSDGIQNQGELGIDCNGPCPGDCDCFNGIRDGDEFLPDCGGDFCPCCNPDCINECKYFFTKTCTYQIRNGETITKEANAFINGPDNLAITFKNPDDSGLIQITQTNIGFSAGEYSVENSNITFISAVDVNQKHYSSQVNGSKGTVIFTDFINRDDCKYVSGSFDVELFSHLDFNKLELKGEFLEVPY